jgi:CDP-diacylglycerol--serine O-phosphatidyltransferase
MSPKIKKSKLTESGRWRRRRDRAKKGLALLPSLLTLGNAICGIAAIIKVAKIQWLDLDPASPYFWATNLREAALLILFGMVFDLLDGRVARLTRMTSDFGGQLDSLSDAITFGVAPGVVTIMANAEARFPANPFWTKVAWTFGLAYSCCAIARLARFNVENDHDEKAHLEFKGLPSPAAAGVISTLLLLQSYLGTPRAERNLAIIPHELVEGFATKITYALPFVALGLGYLMVSKFRYVHVANRFLKGRKPFDYLGLAIMGGVLMSLVPEVMLALGFVGYAVTGPLFAWRKRAPGPAPANPTATPPEAARPEVSAATPSNGNGHAPAAPAPSGPNGAGALGGAAGLAPSTHA